MELSFVPVRFLEGKHPLENSDVKAVFARAKERNLPAYLVGGCLRDALDVPANRTINRTTLDFDFAIGGEALPFARLMSDQLGGSFVVLDEVNDIARVVLKDGVYMDFAGYKGTIVEDINRRDLTINALALDPAHPQSVLDLVGGVPDLESNTIRALREEVLRDDPLRLLRVYRFAVGRRAAIDEKTRSLVKANLPLLNTVARERINYEFFSLMNYPCVGHYITEMGEIGLLELLYPELSECRRVASNSFHHLALFEHSLETIPQLEEILPTLPDYIKESAKKEIGWGVTRLAASKVASLLHDIGKPGTWEIQADGRHSFIGHDKLGAALVKPIANREKWSRTLSHLIESLVLWHLRPGQLFHTGEPTQKALNRFYRTTGEDFPELMLLAFADFGATMGPGLSGEKRDHLKRSLHQLVDGYPVFIEETSKLPRLLGGNDVMSLLSISAGPLVGEILLALNEAQQFKEVTDLAQAEAFVRNYYDVKNSQR